MLLIAGIIGVVASGLISRHYIDKAMPGLPRELHGETAGKGIVPGWVSILNFASWGAGILGVLSLVL